MPEEHGNTGFPRITTDQARELLGLDDRTMRLKMARKQDPLPCLERSGGGRGRKSIFDCRHVFQWGVREALRNGEGSQVFNLDAERGRLAASQADAAELKVSELRSELLRTDIAEQRTLELFAQVRSLLSSLPAQLRRQEPDMTSTTAQRIDETIARAMNTLADLDLTPPTDDDGNAQEAA